MYRKGLGPSNLTGLDENPDYTCLDQAELPVLVIGFAWSLYTRVALRSGVHDALIATQ